MKREDMRVMMEVEFSLWDGDTRLPGLARGIITTIPPAGYCIWIKTSAGYEVALPASEIEIPSTESKETPEPNP